MRDRRTQAIQREKENYSIKSQNIVDDANLPNTSYPIDFSKIRIGSRSLEDAVLNVGNFRKMNERFGNKQEVLRVIHEGNLPLMRDISNFYYKNSGIYSRLCRYLAYLYNYDWLITPYIMQDTLKTEKILNNFNKAIAYLDNSELKRIFGEIALKVVRNGCYYGYVLDVDTGFQIQELPIHYCRSQYKVRGNAAIEFNMRYFDEAFQDTTYRNKVLNLFPPEFKKGYRLYKDGKLTGDFPGDTAGWYLLDIEKAFKMNLNEEDYPVLIAVIPSIIDLDEADELTKRKMQQQLLKIIIQKMPIDKNGDLIFDPDEAQVLHGNAVAMLNQAIGTNVLTTYADVQVADMSDKTASSTITTELDAIKNMIYDEAGISMNQFNTSGNIALERSISNDCALMYNLIQQFESFLNTKILSKFNTSPKKMYFKAQILKTTIYNYQEMAKLYKDQTQIGYSKMLPQIALGQSQSSVLANATFENNILDLVNVFIPPLMSSTMNAEVLAKQATEANSGSSSDGNGEVGRNEKPDSEKSEKTIANRESMS